MSISSRLSRGLLALATLVAGLAATPAAAAPTDIKDQLAAIDGMTVSERAGAGGLRVFGLTYEQPVDHTDPAKGTFQQRATLLHRDVNAPMVLHTSGYGLWPSTRRSEPATLVDGNQLSTEQRYFNSSTPEPKDWTYLTIKQAADDHHRWVNALKPLYSRKWLSTGASKGGMTSVYHRRFHPADIDATIAYVAPNDMDNDEDSAYTRHMATVGEASCRQRISALQKEMLGPRRERMVARFEAAATAKGHGFSQTVGSADAGFEAAVIDTGYAFWQYHLAAECSTIPAASASDDTLYRWFDKIVTFDGSTDEGSAGFTTYFYQASTQLGFPNPQYADLAGVLRYRDIATAPNFVPKSITLPPFDKAAMADVDTWVSTEAERMLFVYGENDPWSAEPFQPSDKDSFTYTAPGQHHGATISTLTGGDRSAAQAAVKRWAGVPAGLSVTRIPGVDDWNPLHDDPRWRLANGM